MELALKDIKTFKDYFVCPTSTRVTDNSFVQKRPKLTCKHRIFVFCFYNVDVREG